MKLHECRVFGRISIVLAGGLIGCGSQAGSAPPPTRIHVSGPPEVTVSRAPEDAKPLKIGEEIGVAGKVKVSDIQLVSFGEITVELTMPARRGDVVVDMMAARLEGPEADGRYRFAAQLPGPDRPGHYAVRAIAVVARPKGYTPEGQLIGIASESMVRSEPIKIKVTK